MDTEFGILLNVLGIFACTYLLAKITNITEGYIAKHILPRARNNANDDLTKNPKIQELEAQIAFFIEQNEELEREVNALKHKYYLSLSQATSFDLQKVCHELKNNIDKAPVDDIPILCQDDSVWKNYLNAKPAFSHGEFPKVVSTYELQKLRGLNV